MAEIATRPVARSDIRALSGVLARAFYDDPVAMFMLPDARARRAALPRMFWALARHHFFSRGGSEVAARDAVIGAASLWDPPGQRKPSRLEELVITPLMLWSFRGRAAQSQAVMQILEESHPEEPHWYLMFLGSDPSVRGAGFGQALLHSRLDRCDGEHAPAYLEASKEELVPYYSRFGFEQIGKIQIPDGPKLWPMWRSPR
ncbi:GNAT family N-acetyltransferase [Mycobacterium sp. 1274761.0]|uniref:GNAT family N-acetyltransferase n=1 Tax=Mycobacterium sp. 1274761.0 TaxID=1834077 RepID=UPI000800EA62|nr:GNAT family N-acetyltransferase [Mycobacterium sp. 1274761.0]OBK77286.1 GNAT family acetyltransferase [Mycobacterium sp. 1274761.0]